MAAAFADKAVRVTPSDIFQGRTASLYGVGGAIYPAKTSSIVFFGLAIRVAAQS